MNQFKRLHKRFKVGACEPPASEGEIAALIAQCDFPIPGEYFNWIREATEIEILVDGRGYIRLWGPSGVIEMNSAYEIQKYIPDSLAIGDDEGGKALLYMNGIQGFGLYLCGFGDLDSKTAKYVASTLNSFLIEGNGDSIGT
jgi:hypothetical protein